MEKYFMITNSDGDTRGREFTREQLLENIRPEDTGAVEFISKLEHSDTNYWGSKILIIKGEICPPKIKKVIEEYDI